MKIAVIGTGKTGIYVVDILKKQGHEIIGLFNSSNPLVKGALAKADVGIAFLTGQVTTNLLPLLLEENRPIVFGSTGLDWPDELDQKLKDKNLTWVYSTNFSLGMRVVHEAINALKSADSIMSDVTYSIHEVHHTKKLDAPSGTAKSWRQWTGKEIKITSQREGDVKGIHELTLSTPREKITIRHEALERSLFAEGALFSATHIKGVGPGLINFEDQAKKILTLKGASDD